jgi:hypothetical protein
MLRIIQILFSKHCSYHLQGQCSYSSWRWQLPACRLCHKPVESSSHLHITFCVINAVLSPQLMSPFRVFGPKFLVSLMRATCLIRKIYGDRIVAYPCYRSRGSSGSIVSDYGLDDRVIEVRSPTGAEDFSSIPCVQTVSEAHPASDPMGDGGPFPVGKARPGSDADHSPPSSGRG